MPIYEYQCERCGHQLEAFQKMSEAPLTDCPACHQAALQKLVSAAGFQLKGSGWYVTDYRDKGKPKATSDAKESGGSEAPARDTASSSDTASTSSSTTSDSSSGKKSNDSSAV